MWLDKSRKDQNCCSSKALNIRWRISSFSTRSFFSFFLSFLVWIKQTQMDQQENQLVLNWNNNGEKQSKYDNKFGILELTTPPSVKTGSSCIDFNGSKGSIWPTLPASFGWWNYLKIYQKLGGLLDMTNIWGIWPYSITPTWNKWKSTSNLTQTQSVILSYANKYKGTHYLNSPVGFLYSDWLLLVLF